jgi:hypothetical protein
LSKSDYDLKRGTMKQTVLKEALGIGLFKASLSMCLGSLTNRFKQLMKLLASQLKEIETEMLELTEGDAELSRKLAYPMSAPGISFITAITVVAETSGFALINSGKQLTSYPGYDVVLRD